MRHRPAAHALWPGGRGRSGATQESQELSIRFAKTKSVALGTSLQALESYEDDNKNALLRHGLTFFRTSELRSEKKF